MTETPFQDIDKTDTEGPAFDEVEKETQDDDVVEVETPSLEDEA